jgi:hypothetical protein
VANRFAFVPKMQDVKDTAKAFGNTMKTFAIGDFQQPDERLYPTGQGPTPPTPTPQPPEAWYRSYGRYAPPKR